MSMRATPMLRPVRAARRTGVDDRPMDIILHLGAHRCATTSFQHYLGTQKLALACHDTLAWTPSDTRAGLFSGVLPGPRVARGRNLHNTRKRAMGRIRMRVMRAYRQGTRQLLISDENMIGSTFDCLRYGLLYPAIGERMARYREAFQVTPKRVVLSVRALDLWWASAAGYSVNRGFAPPETETLEALSLERRSWRDVITDLACALPGTEVIIAPFEYFSSRPDALLNIATGVQAARAHSDVWLNKTPNSARLRKQVKEAGGDMRGIPATQGRWQPLDATQQVRLREAYEDDMHWLFAGAEGLATLAPDPTRTQTGQSLQAGVLTEGRHGYDKGQDHLARSG